MKILLKSNVAIWFGIYVASFDYKIAFIKAVSAEIRGMCFTPEGGTTSTYKIQLLIKQQVFI